MDRPFQLGEVCGGYRILRRLGAGGFSEVYEVVDPEGTLRALKILRAASPGAPLGALLAREVEALARIEHDNVVQVHHAGIEDDHVYLALELVEGVTLRDKLLDPYTPLHTLVSWLQQACDGVAAAHRVGVIHGDLKPANILVTRSGGVKVIDFGVATLRSYSVPTDPIVGTALYMAPEQLQARPSDVRADIYAMGVIAYEALAGVHPLGLTDEHATVFEVFQAHIFGVVPPLREAAPDVPDELAALVHRALARDPARRVPTMRALADGLRRILATLPPPPPRVTLLGLGTDPPPRASLRSPPLLSPRPSAPPPPEAAVERSSDPSPLARDVGRSAFPPPPPRPEVSPSPAPPSPPPRKIPSPPPRKIPSPPPQVAAPASRRSSHPRQAVLEAPREPLHEALREAPPRASPAPRAPRRSSPSVAPSTPRRSSPSLAPSTPRRSSPSVAPSTPRRSSASPAQRPPRRSSASPVVAATASEPRARRLPAAVAALAMVAALAAAAAWEAFTLWDARGHAPATTRGPSGRGPAAGGQPALAPARYGADGGAAGVTGEAGAAVPAEGRPGTRARSLR